MLPRLGPHGTGTCGSEACGRPEPVTRVLSSFDDPCQGSEVRLESPATGLSQRIPSDRLSIQKLTTHGEVSGVLQFPKVRPEISVRFLQQGSESAEADAVAAGEEDAYPEPGP